jgi:hypothetical protein
MSVCYGLPSDANELSEYTALLRALKTSGAIDVDPLVSRAPVDLPEHGFEDDDSEVISEDERGSQIALSLGQHEDFPRPEVPIPRFVPQTTLELRQCNKRRRWPLMANELPSMEWDLCEEIARFAYSILIPDVKDDTMETDAASERKAAVHHAIRAVVLSTLDHLSDILDCIAALRSDSPSAKGRLRAMDWQSVLENVEVQGIASSRYISHHVLQYIAYFPFSQCCTSRAAFHAHTSRHPGRPIV